MKKTEEGLHTLTLRLPNPLHERVLRITEKTGLSITEFIKRAIIEKLNRDESAHEDRGQDFVTREELYRILSKHEISISGDRNKVNVKK